MFASWLATMSQRSSKSIPEGTTFCFEAGTYRLSEPATPRSDQRLIAEQGVVLDGGGTVEDGIQGFGGYQDGVTVRGFTVRNFTRDGNRNRLELGSGGQRGPRHSDRYANQDGALVRDNFIHHNFRYGIVANGYGREVGDRIAIDGNEIAFNNTARHDEGDEGGTKLLKVWGLDVRCNHVHHNYGNGLWTDGDNVDVVYEHNIVEHNQGIGIFHEISYDAIVRNNVVRHNTIAEGRSLFYGSQLHIQNSQNVEVYGNVIDGETHGIGIVSTDRGGGIYGTFRAANIDVHDNFIKMRGATGTAGKRQVTASDITFRDNRYVVPDSGRHWTWGAIVPSSWRQWQAIGNDVGGTRTISP